MNPGTNPSRFKLDDIREVGERARLPFRPARDLSSPLLNPSIRLLSEQDLSDFEEAGCDTGILVDATLLVETDQAGSQIRAIEAKGLRLSDEVRSRQIMVVGATGSGKTYTFGAGAFEAILRDTKESVIRLNLKGQKGTTEDTALVGTLRPDCPVLVFSPGTPNSSCKFNALAYARKYGMTETLLKAVVESQTKGDTDSSFWAFMAEKVLRLLFADSAFESLSDILKVFSDPATLAKYAETRSDRELSEYARFANESSNGATSFNDIGGRLAAFAGSERLAQVGSGANGIDFMHLLSSGQFVLIIECDESVLADTKHLISAMVTLFLESAIWISNEDGGTLASPVNVFLDEFGVIPRLPDFAAKANLYRSRGVRFIVFVQTLQQLRSTYKADCDSLIAAFNSKIFLCSGLDRNDRDFASKLTGNIIVCDWRETQSMDASGEWKPVSRTNAAVQRPLIVPEDFDAPKCPELGLLAIAFLVGQPPAFVYFTPAWKLPVFSKILAGEVTFEVEPDAEDSWGTLASDEESESLEANYEFDGHAKQPMAERGNTPQLSPSITLDPAWVASWKFPATPSTGDVAMWKRIQKGRELLSQLKARAQE